MAQLTAFEIEQSFISFYHKYGFEILPRSSLIDPSLPMTFVGSAGLVQIESAIEHGEDRSGECYVLMQTCFRHFDLDKVGHSPVHLSLFEMGGAFAFGEENRENVLEKIWLFLTYDLGFCKSRLWVTYFAGGELDGHLFEEDTETFQAWRKIGIPCSRIVGVGIKAGFWKQSGGLSGKERFRKCGPTTELFFDCGIERSCGAECHPGCRCGRFTEVANVLFINSQIDQATKSLKPLVTPFAETVIGVERVTVSLQEESCVFDIEPVASIVKAVRGSHRNSYKDISAISECIIADHLRALLLLVADGAPRPGKGGRSRIIRMLIRGILTHQKILGITQADFLPYLVNVVFDIYQYRHLCTEQKLSFLLDYFEKEKKCFERTLSKGYRQLDRVIRPSFSRYISGQQALDLVKSYGFPLPLLEARLSQMDISFNKQEYWEIYSQWQSMI
ncbi:MAG: hypothetical protein GY795_11645 [Desulfobacterales bacterium]|nr:hypothetical protein [Desulfobacterales bacterium]